MPGAAVQRSDPRTPLTPPAGRNIYEASVRWNSFHSTIHFGSLDGLRAVSILAVIWHHGPGFGRSGALGYGYLGVPLFFAISGFLITTLLLREHERNGVISLRRFYIRRSLRIFPLYFLVLGVYCVLMYAIARNTDAGQKFFANLPYFVTYTSNWVVGGAGTFGFAWSLAAEEQFYSTWPFLVRYLLPERAVWVMIGLLSALSFSQTFPWPNGGYHFVHTILSNVPPAICWGCLLAFLLQSRRGFAVLWNISGYRWSPAVVSCLILMAVELTKDNYLSTHFLMAALVASCVIREDHIFAPVLNSRWFIYLGSISYGMYLIHGLIYDSLDEIRSRFLPSWHSHGVTGFLLAAAGTWTLASIIVRYYETPFLRLKCRFGC